MPRHSPCALFLLDLTLLFFSKQRKIMCRSCFSTIVVFLPNFFLTRFQAQIPPQAVASGFLCSLLQVPIVWIYFTIYLFAVSLFNFQGALDQFNVIARTMRFPAFGLPAFFFARRPAPALLCLPPCSLVGSSFRVTLCLNGLSAPRNLSPRALRRFGGLKWTRTTDLTLIRRAL